MTADETDLHSISLTGEEDLPEELTRLGVGAGALGGDNGDEPRLDESLSGDENEELQLEPDSAPLDDGAAEPPVLPEPDRPPATGTRVGGGGPILRLYIILETVQAEVGGSILPVFVRRSFDLGGDEGVVDGVHARNREQAITKAAKLYGAGWRGELTAIPDRYFETLPVENEPDGTFSTKVGRESE